MHVTPSILKLSPQPYDHYAILVPPSDCETKVVVRRYSADQAEKALAAIRSGFLIHISPDGQIVVVTLTTGDEVSRSCRLASTEPSAAG